MRANVRQPWLILRISPLPHTALQNLQLKADRCDQFDQIATTLAKRPQFFLQILPDQDEGIQYELWHDDVHQAQISHQ